MRFIKTIVFLAVVAAAGMGGLIATEFWLDRIAARQPDSANPRPANRETPVTVEKSRLATFREVVEAVGSTRARQSIDIVAMAAGRIERIAFAGGERVEQDQLLVELDDRAERIAVQEARALLDETRANYERIQSLRERNVSSEAALEQARSAFRRAEASLDRAQHNLADRRVHAPFPGTVGLRRVEPGARIDSQTVIASLDDLEEVEIEFSVPENFLSRVALDMPAMARSSAFGERMFEGRISAIDSRISPSARAFKVRATFPNEDLTLRTGMFMSLEIVLDERRSIAVPEEAVVSEGDQSFVYSIVDGKAERIAVSLGLRRDGLVEVRQGLNDGQGVITTGLQNIEHGTTVRTTDPDVARARPGVS